MIPNNNSFPGQNPHFINGVYSYDMRVNVDFNTGRVQLHMPPSVPFTKKQQIYTTNAIPYQTLTNSQPQQLIFIPNQTNQQFYNPKISRSTFAPQQSQSLNSSLHMEHSSQAVQCVICQKIVMNSQFNLHLEQHRNRNKPVNQVFQPSQVVQPSQTRPQYSFQNFSNHPDSITIRNKNSFAEAAELINDTPFYNNSQKNHLWQQSQSQSRSQSRILLPQSQSNLISQSSQSSRIISNPQSQFYLSNSTNSVSSPHMMGNGNSSISRQSLPNQHYYQSQSQTISRNGSGMVDPNLKTNQYIIPSNSQSNFYRQSKNPNGFEFHKIQSVIIRPDEQKIMQNIDLCEQSEISRKSLGSRQSSIYSLQKQLSNNLPQMNNSSSSDQQQSLAVNPTRSYHSVGWTQPRKEDIITHSQYTQKLSRTKLPLNYLAREQFITNTTLNSQTLKTKCFK